MAYAPHADLVGGGGPQKSPTSTVPIELQRQARRVDLQLANLNKIIDTASGDLLAMTTIMGNFSPDLVSKINSLRSTLEAYKGKSAKIFNDVSNALNSYATSLSVNLSDLSDGISKVSTLVDGL